MPDFSIRPATSADLAALAAVELASFEEPWTAQSVAGYWAAPGARAWIAEAADGQPVGSALFRVVVDEAELLRIGTAPAWRRRQVALGLLVAALAELDHEAVDTFLEVRADNLPAQELYRRLGFEFAGRRPKYYSDDCDAWLCLRAARR
ncbi:MAG: GNAT family N-acetyltransferase [Thermoanaerobaculia bacterium]